MTLGYTNVKVLKGGVTAWKEAGFPIREGKPVASLFDRILVPLDGSAASEAVLYQAERLLCGRKSEIVLFHAWGSDSLTFPAQGAAENYLRAIQNRLTAQGARVVRCLIHQGSATESILNAIETERVTLVAMSSHGRGTTPWTGVAGTVEGVLRGSRSPLFLARAFMPSSSGEPIPAQCVPSNIRRILVPLDGSSACEAVMPYAREMGLLLGALMVILHVSSDGDPAAPSDFSGQKIVGRPASPPPGDKATVADRIRYAVSVFSAAGLETMTLNLGGDPVSTILGFARPSAVDLVAMTTHGQTGLSKLLTGPVAETVVREAVLPTLLVSSEAAGPTQCSQD